MMAIGVWAVAAMLGFITNALVITIGALSDYRFDATLEYISPKAVENNGANQFEVKAAVKVTSDRMIRSGYSANAEIILEQAKQVITLPESALEFSGDSTFVYLKMADNTYQRRQVTTGISNGLDIQILSGIEEGDIVRGPKIVNVPDKNTEN